jgi:hypothetical protein
MRKLFQKTEPPHYFRLADNTGVILKVGQGIRSSCTQISCVTAQDEIHSCSIQSHGL